MVAVLVRLSEFITLLTLAGKHYNCDT